jgi:hypothetical protein
MATTRMTGTQTASAAWTWCEMRAFEKMETLLAMFGAVTPQNAVGGAT